MIVWESVTVCVAFYVYLNFSPWHLVLQKTASASHWTEATKMPPKKQMPASHSKVENSELLPTFLGKITYSRDVDFLVKDP